MLNFCYTLYQQSSTYLIWKRAHRVSLALPTSLWIFIVISFSAMSGCLSAVCPPHHIAIVLLWGPLLSLFAWCFWLALHEKCISRHVEWTMSFPPVWRWWGHPCDTSRLFSWTLSHVCLFTSCQIFDDFWSKTGWSKVILFLFWSKLTLDQPVFDQKSLKIWQIVNKQTRLSIQEKSRLVSHGWKKSKVKCINHVCRVFCGIR